MEAKRYETVYVSIEMTEAEAHELMHFLEFNNNDLGIGYNSAQYRHDLGIGYNSAQYRLLLKLRALLRSTGNGK